jgi:hypothetical protein
MHKKIIQKRLVSRPLAALAAIAFMLLVPGCVVSKAPLFDPANAVMPVSAGNFAEEVSQNGQWVKIDTVRLSLRGRSYQSKNDTSDEKIDFALYEAGTNFYVVAAVDDRSKTRYALAEKTDGGYLLYQPSCDDYQFVRLPSELQPHIDVDECVYDNGDKLTRALVAFAKVSLPQKRYASIKP